jgi:primosomal protein N' (replication factor Y)
MAASVAVGTVVRVPLHGRRVRGWVTALDVEPETGARLLPVARRSSEGPDAATVDLARWVAHRWAGSLALVLRAATPVHNVRQRPPRRPARAPAARPAPTQPSEHAAVGAADTAREHATAVVRWPPLLDRRLLVADLLAPRGSTIVVTADARRARALVEWLQRLGHHALLERADRPAAQRAATWHAAAAGECVVVGGRVAAFAPVPDLAAAIVVDDADEALQEERAPTWHARDVLAERARRAGARFTVVAAAPSVDATERYAPVVAPVRAVEHSGWPRVDVVDRRLEPPGAGLFPDAVARALRDALATGPAVCVVNRRGRSRLLACAQCATLQRRDPAGRPLWERPAPGAEPPDLGSDPDARICLECGSTRLRVLRAGVSRIEEEIAALLPSTRVASVDTATLEVAPADVVVGTESVLHRSEIRDRRPALVAFLDFDQELLAARFRAGEQAMMLVVRAARLLDGRDRRETRIVLSTRQPAHDVVRAAAAADPEVAAAPDRAQRIALGLPPYGALAELIGDVEAVAAACDALGALDLRSAGVQVLGPSATGDRALVQAPDPEALADALAHAAPLGRRHGAVRVHVDPPRV